MEVTKTFSNYVSPRKGCDPIMSTQRGKMQNQRSLINQQLSKQIRLREGAENLFNATTNPKVKETVALELSFVNSSLQLLKEELNEINSRVEPYQNISGKAVSIPMLPLGLKETIDLEFVEVFEDFIANHYKEDAGNYCDELADFADMRTATRTPSRTFDGVALLFEYYNQLLHIENRFFSPNKPLSIYFRWYDAISGVPSIQRSIALEKASILFNIGALYSQFGTRSDRSRRSGIETAIDTFQRSAGMFDYLRKNFIHAPTPDLKPSFLSALVKLMLAQAQESALELKLLGGFKIQLGKCISIAQEAMKVADKYSEAETAFETESVKNYMPYSWLSMVQVKSHHYRALSHYYAGLGLLEQHELAEPVEIARLLSTLYQHDVKDSDVPKPDDAAQKKEDRRRLGKSHLRHAIFCHEQALQTHSLCKISRTIDVLKEYLQHAHRRSLSKFAEIDNEEDFFELIDAPSIQASTETESCITSPEFERFSSPDIFLRLGPISSFSCNHLISPPRTVTLNNQNAACGFTLHGDSPVTLNNVDEESQRLGFLNDDIIVAVDNVDMKWSDHDAVADVIAKKRGSPVTFTLVRSQAIPVNVTVPSIVTADEEMQMMLNVNGDNFTGLDRNNSVTTVTTTKERKKPNHLENIKNRHSLGIFRGLKIRALQNRFSTVTENTSNDINFSHKQPVTLQRSSSTTKSFLKASASVVLRQKVNHSNGIQTET